MDLIMVYLEETFNLSHASWEALDTFIDFSERAFVPIYSDLGARLVIAWSSDVAWFCQVKQILEFNDMEALKEFRINCSQSRAWGEYTAELEDHAQVRSSRLLEPLGVISPEVLTEAIEDSNENPSGGYLQANLEVAPDKMGEFCKGLSNTNEVLPKSCQLIASWRPMSGGPNEVIDIWKAPEPQKAYSPADEESKEFFRYVRQLAPKESAVRMLALPYSPLR